MVRALERRYEADVIASRAFDSRLDLPVPTHDGWLVPFYDRPEVVVLDAGLNELRRVDLGVGTKEYCRTGVAQSRDGSLFAVSAREGLTTRDAHGRVLHRLPHVGWDTFAGSGCVFDEENRLWYVRPSGPRGMTFHLRVIDPRSAAVLGEIVLDCDVGRFDLYLHPNTPSVLVDVGCGQDGCYQFRADLSVDGLTCQPFEHADRVFTGGLSPLGDELVTGAHGGDAVKVLSVQDGRVLASVDAEDLFRHDPLEAAVPDAVGYEALFLDPATILADTRFRRLVLIRRSDMQALGTLWPRGYRLQGYDQAGKPTDDPERLEDYEGTLSSMHLAGQGRVLTVHDERRLELVDVSPVLAAV